MRFEAATTKLLKAYQAEVESVVERAKKSARQPFG
jgi:hypothetical protein